MKRKRARSTFYFKNLKKKYFSLMLDGANKLKFQKFICLKSDFDKQMYKK